MSKKCKGTGQAKGYGCGKPLDFETNKNGIKTYMQKYGLCYKNRCYQEWLLNSEKGIEKTKKIVIISANKIKENRLKDFRKRKRESKQDNAMGLADMYFSRYIRLLYSDNGKCTCYTCGNVNHIKETDNGHYQKREHKGTRYNINNCRPQCKTCNGDVKHNGKQDVFRVQLVNEIGEEEVLEVERLAKTVFKVNSKYFRDIADEYRIKVNDIQNKLKIKYW